MESPTRNYRYLHRGDITLIESNYSEENFIELEEAQECMLMENAKQVLGNVNKKFYIIHYADESLNEDKE